MTDESDSNIFVHGSYANTVFNSRNISVFDIRANIYNATRESGPWTVDRTQSKTKKQESSVNRDT